MRQVRFSNKRRNMKQKKGKIDEPRWFRHPPAEAPFTQFPVNSLVCQRWLPLQPLTSSSSESAFKLTISRREKCAEKSRKDIQNSPSRSKVKPTSSFSSLGINCHSGDLNIQSRWESFSMSTRNDTTYWSLQAPFHSASLPHGLRIRIIGICPDIRGVLMSIILTLVML